MLAYISQPLLNMNLQRAGLTVAALILLGLAMSVHASRDDDSDMDRVVVLRCDTSDDGKITVRNSSATSAVDVTIRRGDRCAATISDLLMADMEMVRAPMVASRSADHEASYSFVLALMYLVVYGMIFEVR